MPKGLGLAAAAGLTSGLVTLSVISGGGLGMLLAYVTPLPLILVGLAFGLTPCLVSLAAGALVLAVAGWTAVPPFLAIGAIPALLVTAVALRGRAGKDGKIVWGKPGPMLLIVALGAVIMMALAVLSLLVEGKDIEGWLREQATPVVEQAFGGTPDDVKSAIIGLMAAVLPAMVGLAWLAMTLANGVFGQWVVTRAGWALRPTPSYTELDLPLWLAPAAGVVAAASLVGGDIGYLARNAAILLVAPYLVTGLVDVHMSLRGRPMASLWLAVFYGVFLALFGWAAMAVTAWGVVRQWTRLRQKDTAPRPDPSDRDPIA